MSKHYVVLHGSIGGNLAGPKDHHATRNVQGALITAEDVTAGDIPRLLALGAIRVVTPEDEAGGPTADPALALGQAKQAEVGASAPELATGSPGGAPLAADAAGAPSPAKK